MPPQVMLPTEGSAASAVGTDMRLETVGVMSGHVCLEIVCTGEGYGKIGQSVSAITIGEAVRYLWGMMSTCTSCEGRA